MKLESTNGFLLDDIYYGMQCSESCVARGLCDLSGGCVCKQGFYGQDCVEGAAVLKSIDDGFDSTTLAEHWIAVSGGKRNRALFMHTWNVRNHSKIVALFM